MFWITTNDGHRAALWRRLTGSDCLPVTSACPRTVATESGLSAVFDLDAARLHPAALDRVAAYIARCKRIPYAMAKAHVGAGVTIPAKNCTVVTEPSAAESQTRRRPLFRWWGRHEHQQDRNHFSLYRAL